MQKNIWQVLPKPIKVLAPMEDVTDTVFRRVVASCGKPDIFFTEFTSTDGMYSPGRDSVIKRLKYTEEEKPLIAQIWGNNPENYFKAANEIATLGFDGIDINMGCPVNKIASKGCCSALIDNPTLAKELIAATRQGANGLAVSVKTRMGFKSFQTIEWASFLLEQDLDAITFHGRIAKHQSKYPADWDEIKKTIELRDQAEKSTIIIGNGDVSSYQDIQEKYQEYGVDGLMIGRGIFQNLYIFNKNGPKSMQELSAENKLTLLLFHLKLFKERWGEEQRYATMKKFYKIYINQFPKSSELRIMLMETSTVSEAVKLIKDYIDKIEEDKTLREFK